MKKSVGGGFEPARTKGPTFKQYAEKSMRGPAQQGKAPSERPASGPDGSTAKKMGRVSAVPPSGPEGTTAKRGGTMKIRGTC